MGGIAGKQDRQVLIDPFTYSLWRIPLISDFAIARWYEDLTGERIDDITPEKLAIFLHDSVLEAAHYRHSDATNKFLVDYRRFDKITDVDSAGRWSEWALRQKRPRGHV